MPAHQIMNIRRHALEGSTLFAQVFSLQVILVARHRSTTTLTYHDYSRLVLASGDQQSSLDTPGIYCEAFDRLATYTQKASPRNDSKGNPYQKVYTLFFHEIQLLLMASSYLQQHFQPCDRPLKSPAQMCGIPLPHN